MEGKGGRQSRQLEERVRRLFARMEENHSQFVRVRRAMEARQAELEQRERRLLEARDSTHRQSRDRQEDCGCARERKHCRSMERLAWRSSPAAVQSPEEGWASFKRS